MIKQGMTILYVSDQEAAKLFYELVLEIEPSLHVPGMTEFKLKNGVVLGLMPINGIKQLLGHALFKGSASNVPRVEMYLHVDDAQHYLDRAIKNGAELILEMSLQNWGDRVGYCLDLDRHVLAFAETPK
jgi:uncharacterized glyoxalase superfamily protein PhnB